MQREILEYVLVFDSTAKGLAGSVNSYIRDGWQPWGSPCMTQPTPESHAGFSQAMVKFR